jgi:hypothetical protein
MEAKEVPDELQKGSEGGNEKTIFPASGDQFIDSVLVVVVFLFSPFLRLHDVMITCHLFQPHHQAFALERQSNRFPTKTPFPIGLKDSCERILTKTIWLG